MSQEPSWRDSWTDLWRKTSRNTFEFAVSKGYAGTLEPNPLDNHISAMRKVCFYTAWIVDHTVGPTPGDSYFRPDGVSTYMRPDGTSVYLRP